MAATIKIKNSSTASAVPTSSDLVQGELAVNVTDKRIFTENASGTVVELGTNPSTLTVAAGATIQGLTVGKGAGAVSTNTAVGASALSSGSLSGGTNTAVGNTALQANTTGINNSALGHAALVANTTGSENSAYGSTALVSNTTGSYNVGVGRAALYSNTTASNNTAVGYQAGYTNSTGTQGVFLGYQAGYTTNGNYNTYLGYQAGVNATSGTLNTFVGNGAGTQVTTGGKNVILGSYNGNQSGLDIRTASNYIVLSDGDGTPRVSINSTGSTQFFGYNTIQASTLSGANSSSANAIFAGRYGATTPLNGTDCIFITSNGNLYNTNGTYGTLSDAKLKENIVDASSQWDDIKALRVRNFNFKDGQTHTQIGYIAQEVEAVSPSLVDTNSDFDAEGNDLGTTTKSLKLSVINIKAVKALQEAMERIERMEAEIAALKGQA